RSVEWRPSAPATLIWVEALDGGDLRKNVPYRDHILAMEAPFSGQPNEVFKLEQRFQGIQMGSKSGIALVEDFERRKRWTRTIQIDLNKLEPARVVWSRNNQDRYHDPGRPMETRMPNGQQAMIQDGNNIYLAGLGASAKGDHPFLDRFNLDTQKSERLFQCDDDHYEVPEALLDEHGTKFLTRRESPTEPPNYFVRTSLGEVTAVTKFPDPQPSIRGIHKELVKYKRADGV